MEDLDIPAPEEVHRRFTELLAHDSRSAADYLYGMGVGCGYIHPETLEDNPHWTVPTRYGDLEITVNATKPEKDPRDIANAAEPVTDSEAPQCDLCKENETWPGSPEHPAKPGLRLGSLELGGEPWWFQYSPYGYFEEHCIVLSDSHRPMSIEASNVKRLFDFVDRFPFYFVGSNADLPIVGGSILGHDHFQGGRHRFPLMDAAIKIPMSFPHPNINGGIVRWPASVLRMRSEDRMALEAEAASIIDAWRVYDDASMGIVAFGSPDGDSSSQIDGVGCNGTKEAEDREPHNTLNPILHREGKMYVLDLVLRNNRTDDSHPWGIFHPAENLHHIKKENIGLIEIMGLAILPPRLLTSLGRVHHHMEDAKSENLAPEEFRLLVSSDEDASAHADWATDIYRNLVSGQNDAEGFHNSEQKDALGRYFGPEIEMAVGKTFEEVLESTAVFPDTPEGECGFLRFLFNVGITPCGSA